MNAQLQTNTLIRAVFSALLVLGAAIGLHAQESLIALGNVRGNGVLDASANTVSGVVASGRTAAGAYTVTVTAAGAFAGSAPSDYIVATTPESTSSDDVLFTAAVNSVTNDVVEIFVRGGDVESTADSGFLVAEDEDFHFVLRRIDSSLTEISGDSRLLLATGVVGSNGTLFGGFGVNGVTVTSLRAGAGDYFVTLTKAGAFSGDGNLDYVLELSPIDGSEADQTIRGAVSSTLSDDAVSINVHTDDVQAFPGTDTQTPSSSSFAFSVYAINNLDAVGVPASRVVSALASVTGAGAVVAAKSSIPGGTVSASRSSAGVYQVDLVAVGSFAGKTANDFAALVHINNDSFADEIAKSQITIVDADTLRVAVFTDDMQTNGDTNGAPTDSAFTLTLLNVSPAIFPDLTLGRTANPATFRGAGIINNTGGGQGIRLPLTGTASKRAFFGISNAGDSVDGLRVKGLATAGPLGTRFFHLDTIRRNVTAQVKIGAAVDTEVRPGEEVLLESVIRYRSAERTPAVTMRVRAISQFAPANVDLGRVFVVRR